MNIMLMSIIVGIISLTNVFAQKSQFAYQAKNLRTGQVLVYKKSNQDGSNLHWVASYISSPTHIESLKWMDGREEATLVTADIDWSLFSVSKFVAGRMMPNGEWRINGRLDLLNSLGEYQVKGFNTMMPVGLMNYPILQRKNSFY